jgi:bacteriocin-like protein
MHTKAREIDLLSDEINLLSDDELDAISGGMKWIDIHMPYGNFIKWPGAIRRRPDSARSLSE